jgi:hypothetical protein
MKLINKQVLATGLNNNNINLWNITSGLVILTLKGHSSVITSLELLHDKILVSGSVDTKIKLWNTTNGQLIMTLSNDKKYSTCFTVLKDGRLVSGSNEGTIIIWNKNTYQVNKTLLSNHNGAIRSMIVIGDKMNQKLVGSSYDKKIKVWYLNNDSYKEIHENKDSNLPSSLLVLNPEIFISYDSEIRFWNSENQKLNAKIKLESEVSALLGLEKSSYSFLLVCATFRKEIQIWHIEYVNESRDYKITLVKTFYQHIKTEIITSLEKLLDNKFFSISLKNIKLWPSLSKNNKVYNFNYSHELPSWIEFQNKITHNLQKNLFNLTTITDDATKTTSITTSKSIKFSSGINTFSKNTSISIIILSLTFDFNLTFKITKILFLIGFVYLFFYFIEIRKQDKYKALQMMNKKALK